MAIASVGTLGVAAASTSASSYTLTTATNTLAAGDFALLMSVTDNIATADGNTSNHTSVTGGTGTWTKLGEYTNTVGGVAGDGVTTSLWLFEATGAMAVGTVITMNLSAATVDKAAQFWKFTKAAGLGVRLITGTTNPITNGTDAANGFGSVAFSGLASAARLYFRGLGKEANSTTAITPSTGFTAIAGNRSRNNASAVLVRAEFRINTSTGETSNPTLAVVGDTANVFAALEEFAPPITGTLSAQESGGDTSAIVGQVIVQGSGAAQETGEDVFAASGTVAWPPSTGTLAAQESGEDTFSASGTVTSVSPRVEVSWAEFEAAAGAITGTLAAQESGADTFAGAGAVLVRGSLSAQESGEDTFAAAGRTIIQGTLSAQESGQDTFTSSGVVVVRGSLAAQESGADTFAGAGIVVVQGALSAQESGQDVATMAGQVLVQGALAAQETGQDTFTASGGSVITTTGSMAVQETGEDTFASTGRVVVQGTLSAQESGADTFTAAGTVAWPAITGTLAAQEAGADTFAGAGQVVVRGSLSAQESGQDAFAATGAVRVAGSMSAQESGEDTFAATGQIIVRGALAAQESGSDTFTADGIVREAGITGSMSAQESGSDTFAGAGTVGTVFTITGAQALLLRRLCQLHGLVGDLEVGPTERRNGDLVQTVSQAGGAVTIATVAGADLFVGNAGTLIEELAALHGLTAPLTVTATQRQAGAIVQSITTAGGVTRVVRQ